MRDLVLAIDAGTTGTRVLAFDRDQQIIADAYHELPRQCPQPGWVEQDASIIWSRTRAALAAVCAEVGSARIAAIGITNQRETTVLWDRLSGEPLAPAIVWQDRRTQPECAALAKAKALAKSRTGLFIDPYFSATKIRWLIDHVPAVATAVADGRACFGTVDSWLIWCLTGGQVHATDPSNASRTLCFGLAGMAYDPELLDLFGVPAEILPEVRPSAGDFGRVDRTIIADEPPLTGVLGDQQAALFGQGGWQAGAVKNTYGTGLFLMTASGAELPESGDLLNTVAWQIGDDVTYALEGSVFIGGACLQWLRDGLQLFADAADSAAMAAELTGNDGVYFVPALAGLGAPYWDPSARGLIIGLTQGTSRAHLARAALEAIAYQTRDIVDTMRGVLPGLDLRCLRVDGGACRNDWLMQFQSDVTGLQIERPAAIESTALGAAAIAGLGAGLWSRDQLAASRRVERVFEPAMSEEARADCYAGWQRAVQRSLAWQAS